MVADPRLRAAADRDDPRRRTRRRTGLSSVGVENGGFWEGKTRTALQALLHAAALDGRSPASSFGGRSTRPRRRMPSRSSVQPAAATGWAESLEAMIDADPRTRDSIWQGVSLALAALADPRVLDAVSPTRGRAVRPGDFLRRNGTLYLLATGAGAGASSSLVAAFIEDLVETRGASPRARPAPASTRPLLLALDEIGNLAPLPSLPVLMAEGGGTGITTMPVLQSLAQARSGGATTRRPRSGTRASPRSCSAAPRDLGTSRTSSTLIGERDEVTDTITIGERGMRSNSAINAPGSDHAARRDSHAAVRHRAPAAEVRTADRHSHARMGCPPRRRGTPCRAGSSRGTTAAGIGDAPTR